MLKILQLYVARELFKTFALTAIGLTLTFSLCGGVLNMIQAEEVTSLQMLRIMGFVLPVALTLTLPVSAMFACAIVYGRFAVDNEFDACRASGINIHRLLVPALVLSVFTGVFTFSFANYVLPTFIEQLDAMVRKDMEKIVSQALKTRGHVRQGPYVLYAGQTSIVPESSGRKALDIREAAFLELENENLKRCGTASAVTVDFIPNPAGGNPNVQAAMLGVYGLDIERKEFYQVGRQSLQSMEIPSKLKEKPKFLDLSQLFRYQRELTALPTMRRSITALRMLIGEALFYRWIAGQLQNPPGHLRLGDANVQYDITAERLELNEKDFHPKLVQPHVVQTSARLRRDYHADNCTIRLRSGGGRAPDTTQLLLAGHARFTDARDPQNVIEQKDIPLPEVAVPAEFPAQVQRMSDAQVLDLPDRPLVRGDYGALQNRDPKPLGLSGRVESVRVSMRKDIVRLGMEIASIIHSRLAFSVSTLVMLVLAAALGMIFRGGQLLTAFVISFVPGLLVVVMNIMGRNLAENFGTQLLGLIVIWSAIALVALADVVVLGIFLRR